MPLTRENLAGYGLLEAGRNRRCRTPPADAAAGIDLPTKGDLTVPTATPNRATTRSVAVMRALAGIGDLVCAVPALRSLRAGLPDAHVTLVGLPWASAFVERFRGYVDELVVFPGFPGIPEIPPAVNAFPPFLEQMQGRRFDLAVQLHGSGNASNPFTLLLGASETAGFYLPGQPVPSGRFIPYPADRHELRRLTALTASLGMPDTGDTLEWPVTEEDRAELRSVAGELEPGTYAVVHPGASEHAKRWPAEHFGAVAERLSAEGLRVVLTGVAEDAPLAGALAARMRVAPLDLTGRTTLGALGALVSGARLLVCNDTGVSHVAAGLRTPSVVVFSASEVRRWAPLDAELHRSLSAEGGGVVGLEEVLDSVELQLRRGGERVA